MVGQIAFAGLCGLALSASRSDERVSAQTLAFLSTLQVDPAPAPAPAPADAEVAPAPAPAEPEVAPDVAPAEPPVVEPDRGPAVDPALWTAYHERRPKTIFELQPYRHTTQIQGEQGIVATLIELAPRTSAWSVLVVGDPGASSAVYHLENPDPGGTTIALDPEYLQGVMLVDDSGRQGCSLWAQGELQLARASGQPFAPLCEGRLWLRNPVSGRKTSREWASDFLRDRVWYGEQLTVLVRDELYKDTWLRVGETVEDDMAAAQTVVVGAPRSAAIDEALQGTRLVPDGLDLPVRRPDEETALIAGHFYPVEGQEGVFVSAFQTQLVPTALRETHEAWLDPISQLGDAALVYVVAFDLDQFDIGFALGTDHPRLGWSERLARGMADPSLPGPDGIDSDAPLVRTGQVPPWEAGRLVAAFTAGFKRAHGAFRHGERAAVHDGSHYGFVENGVIFSKLLPGLATLVIWDDGELETLTWTVEDDARLYRVRHARQNGVPIVEADAETGQARPGSLVRDWKQGNWSGSAEGNLRTLRAVACIQQSEAGRFLLYEYFTGATPSGLALVSMAYGCDYAMMMDMNALEHTYLAVYGREGDSWSVHHVDAGMDVLDKTIRDGQVLPRFVAFPDNRDFFWLSRRPSP